MFERKYILTSGSISLWWRRSLGPSLARKSPSDDLDIKFIFHVKTRYSISWLPPGCPVERRQNTSKLGSLCGTNTALPGNTFARTANRSRCNNNSCGCISTTSIHTLVPLLILVVAIEPVLITILQKYSYGCNRNSIDPHLTGKSTFTSAREPALIRLFAEVPAIRPRGARAAVRFDPSYAHIWSGGKDRSWPGFKVRVKCTFIFQWRSESLARQSQTWWQQLRLETRSKLQETFPLSNLFSIIPNHLI